jgi:hypothetical protein
VTDQRPAWLPVAETCAFALWLGAALFFAGAVAPTAFGVLPTDALAGALVGRLLPVLFGAGMGVGLLVLAFEIRAARLGAGRVRSRLRAAAILLALCTVAQFVVGGQIDRLRARVAQPIDSLARDDPRRVAFGRWHAVSVAALGAAMLAAAVGAASGRPVVAEGERGT